MKIETFEVAQTLNTKIDDYNRAIEKMNDPKPAVPTINLSFMYEEESEALKNSILNFLKNRRSKLQNEFNKLK